MHSCSLAGDFHLRLPIDIDVVPYAKVSNKIAIIICTKIGKDFEEFLRFAEYILCPK